MIFITPTPADVRPAERREGLPAVDERIDLISDSQDTGSPYTSHSNSTRSPAGDHAVEVVLRQSGYELAGAIGAVIDAAAARRVEAEYLTQAAVGHG